MENLKINFDNSQELFSKLLYEALSEDKCDEREKCLITGDVLDNDCIKMNCNHCFNYNAIFNEVKVQKNTIKKYYNSLETQKLGRGEIKCPYCRNVQKGLLPYRSGFPKIKYVNWPPSLIMKTNKCMAVLKSGKRKGEICGKVCCEKYCGRHMYKAKSENSANTTESKHVNSNFCVAIIKNGKRKGEICGCKLKSKYIQNKRCGKHFRSVFLYPLYYITYFIFKCFPHLLF